MREKMNSTNDIIDTTIDTAQDEQLKKQFVKAGSLIDHYGICYNIINTPDIDANALAWVFAYVRLFTIKEVRMDMRCNYQTKDISHMQSELSMALARAYVRTFSIPDAGSDSRATSDFHTGSDSSAGFTPRAESSPDAESSPYAALSPEAAGALSRVFIRNIINFIPRGGGNGDELRLFILDVMRRHGIREGHRPGIDDPFIEQWHQKLHSNCTSEDITICEAYIAFQETNSSDTFYRILWERGGISRDFLRNMARPLTHDPRYMPQLVPDLKHILWILKQIHGGSHNFHYLLEASKWQFDGELFSMLEDVKNNFGAWWLPGKIIDCRYRLKHYLQSSHCPRDPLMIDVALDNIYKASIERIDLRTLSGGDLVVLVLLTLQNIQLSYDDHEKITSSIDLWRRIKDADNAQAWSPEWGLQALAAFTSSQLAIQSYTDKLYEFIQPRARMIGRSCNIPESYLIHFAEEVIRSQSTFALSRLMDALFPMLCRTAQIGCWKIISQGRGSSTGTISLADSLRSIQGRPSEKRRIMLVDKVEGIEEIPPWVSAILTMSDVDILSHISIRCRSSKVILSTCYDRAVFEKLKLHEGKRLTVSIENSMVHCREANKGEVKIISSDGKRAADNTDTTVNTDNTVNIDKTVNTDTMANMANSANMNDTDIIYSTDSAGSTYNQNSTYSPSTTCSIYSTGRKGNGSKGNDTKASGSKANGSKGNGTKAAGSKVTGSKGNGTEAGSSRVTGSKGNGTEAGSSRAGGSKSGNLARLRGKLSDFIKVPSSAIIPYEVFEQALRRDQESVMLLNELTAELHDEPEIYPFTLAHIRRLIHDLPVPGDLVRSIREEIAKQEDIISQWSKPLENALVSHIKKVWGSIWNERAYLSRSSRHITSDRIRMRVLIQKVIPADYAFVIHTHNPVSNKSDEILAEIVVGLGETLAGNSPGAPLGVILTKKERKYTIISYPSKQIACFDSQHGESCIVRSDSNDEDISDSPGAGLYDSYFINRPTPALVRYDRERLFWDKGFQRFLFDSIAHMAEEIEAVMECPQDIEGAYAGDSFYVVQTRNQLV
jgi:hypothetical protein